MIPVIVKWVAGPPKKYQAGQFVVYDDGSCQLIGTDEMPIDHYGIHKHTTLIEPHELDWLQSMAVERSLGVLK